MAGGGGRGVWALLVSDIIVSFCFGLGSAMNDLHNSTVIQLVNILF